MKVLMEPAARHDLATSALQVRCTTNCATRADRREKASRIPVSLALSLFAYISLSIDYPVQLLKTLTAQLL